MEIKHCVVQKKGSEPMVVKVSEMEKPNGEEYYEEHQIAVDEVDQIFNNELYQSDLLKWQQSFKEYPVKDEDEWFNLFGIMIAKRNHQFKTDRSFGEILRIEGIEIDPSRVEIKSYWDEWEKEDRNIEYAILLPKPKPVKVKEERHEFVSELEFELNAFGNWCAVNSVKLNDSNQICEVIKQYLKIN